MKRFLSAILLLALCISVVSAAPSIGVLAPSQDAAVTVITGDTQRPAPEDTVSGDAVPDQYRGALAEAIALSEKTESNTGSSGHAPADPIPSVSEIITCFDPNYTVSALEGLKQLTFVQDLKDAATGLPISADAWGTHDFVRVTLSGGELTRDAKSEEFTVVLFDTARNTVHLLDLQSYDPDTGDYTVDLPCIGPFLLTWHAVE